jgi:hypothetical protein
MKNLLEVGAALSLLLTIAVNGYWMLTPGNQFPASFIGGVLTLVTVQLIVAAARSDI